MNPILKVLFISLAFLSLTLGILGIVVPLLPTTPFLLLSSALFFRSSEKFHNWLLNHRLFGRYIRYYRDGKGLPIKVKFFTLLLLWLTIISSAIFFTSNLHLRIFLAVVLVGVTLHILLLPTYKQPSKDP